MSSAASEVIKVAPPAAEAAAPELQDLVPMVESTTDRHETLLVYDPSSKVPIPVVLVWICALIGLGTYMVTLYLPDLALWAK